MLLHGYNDGNDFLERLPSTITAELPQNSVSQNATKVQVKGWRD